ncbi:hypothetical protein DW099_02465 [Emergencia timonensis]|uniref:Uncharacterized protein n=1 Tax=Emergencia timonensis TaxID=1776384 RepID=A0A415E6P3_9FIRM|nr:hypothetical protein DW099_02465 [Emergencia timonensis]
MTGRKDEALCRVLSIRAFETDAPSFSFFCLFLADFLIIVNQCAFICKFLFTACAFQEFSAYKFPLFSIQGVCRF